ncbi:ABC transporter substrate-binding protein [Homoserinibacter sp. GY 40078]|uniref:ABC transporter substrate-binding protein n=1 Tax=Homoserinibacter sp. GY 40078 TaxID=2603275 RepID=UPI0011C72D89|nr:ABC transporter substrate-binding protein [Homoserinibacter sp. GY 40078]TXK19299.1 ABC transporter substrate-binding protein [Homoserinibacter sp. GY 40078]
MNTIRRGYRAAVITAVSAIALTACATADDTTSDSASDSGDVIVAAADPSLLPYNFIGDDGSTWEGLNVDLAAALSEELGQTIEFESASFDTIIPGLASGRYDIALTGMFDTKERQETVDFVDYLRADNNFLTREGYREIADLTDLCGEKVGIPGGALEGQWLASESDTCVADGNEPIDVSEFADLDAVVLALTSGRIDVAPNDSAANAYIAKGTDGLVVSGSYENEGYFAVGFPKDSDLTEKFEAAFTALIEDGTYAEILETWGIPGRALDAPIINGSPF